MDEVRTVPLYDLLDGLGRRRRLRAVGENPDRPVIRPTPVNNDQE